jgi:hypothetical protein
MASDQLKKLQDSLWEILTTLDTKECSVRQLYGFVIKALRDSMVSPEFPTSELIVLDADAPKKAPHRFQDGKSVHEMIKENLTSTEKKELVSRKAASRPAPAPAPAPKARKRRDGGLVKSKINPEELEQNVEGPRLHVSESHLVPDAVLMHAP